MRRSLLAPLLAWSLLLTRVHAEPAATPPLYVGLYRRVFNEQAQPIDNLGWTTSAKTLAARFPGAHPVILHRCSSDRPDGTTRFGFPLPPGYRGSTSGLFFRLDKFDHEQALTTYDHEGVSVILELRPASTDVLNCFEVALAAFGQHRCLLGFGIDVDAYRIRESGDGVGLPITDADAQRWMERLLRFKPTALLVLKHFEPQYLPPTYRHPNLCLVTDDRGFASQAEWLKSFRDWHRALGEASLGAFYGSETDASWAGAIPQAPIALGRALLHEWPHSGVLLWASIHPQPDDFAAPP
jgi:hypothetical protein